MARIFIVDERGARAGDLAAARERFDEANKEAFGADLDINAHTPQNQIAGINALVATELGEELVRAALYGSSINHSVGIFLDSLGTLLDIRRSPATRSRVTGILMGNVGTVVPQGSLVKNTSGDTFESEVDATIVSGGTPVGFIAKDTGPIDVGVGTLTKIVSVRAGWSGVNNVEEGIVGRDRESDALYRANLKARTAHSSIGSIAAMESALQSAGAVRIKILENSSSSPATRGGILLPEHSILVIADGGLEDDIARAVENHRGMGVNTYTAFEGTSFSLSEAQKINAGRMIFDGTEFGGFDLGGRNVPQIAVALNAATSEVNFTESNGRLITLHSWDTNSTGFEDLGGNITESERPLVEFKPTYAKAAGRLIVMQFPESLESDPTITVKYTSGGSETTATISNSTRATHFMAVVLSSAIPAAATDIKVTMANFDTATQTGLTLTDIPIELESGFGSTDVPSLPVVSGRGRNASVNAQAFAFGTITKWQYRRWSNGSYLDSDWVDDTGTLLGTARYLNATYTGFTNGVVSRLEVRAVNGAHGETAARSFVFEPSSAAPAIESSRIDGNLITLTYNANLSESISTNPSNAWTIQASGSNPVVATVSKQQTIGRKALLTLNNAANSSSNWVVSTGSSPSITGSNGVQAGSLSSRALANDTKAGIPSAPIGLVARNTATGWEADWSANANGGLAVDRYEISTMPVGSNVWTPWITNTPSTSTSYSTPAASAVPERVRVRASNQNARAAEILGLLGTGTGVIPFTRSVERPLVIGVSIHRDAAITTSDFDAIKTSLVDLVNSYEIGTTIYQADLQARVEGIKSIRLASPLTATSNGIAIDGVVQNAYNRWTLDPADISVTFVN